MKNEKITKSTPKRETIVSTMLRQLFTRRIDKVIFVFLLMIGALLFSYAGMTVSAAPLVKFVSYTVDDKPIIYDVTNRSVTVSGWGITYNFDILGWESEESDHAWEDTTITGRGVSVAKGSEGKATFTTSSNTTGGTVTAGTVTIQSPGGVFSFTVKQNVITYSISYIANGGTGAPANQTKTHTVDIRLSNVKPFREGYSFDGWATSPGSQKKVYRPGQYYRTNRRLSLYAVWIPKKVDITWDSNGGSAVKSSLKKTVGDLIGELPTTKRNDCVFNGWYTGAGGTGSKVSSKTSVPTRDTTYYANWTLKSGQSSSQNLLSVDKALLEFSYRKNSEKTVTVKGYGNSSKVNDWKKLKVSAPNWVKVDSKTKGKLKILVEDNTKTQNRSGIVVIKSYDGRVCQISVLQKAMPVSVSSVLLDKEKASIDIHDTVALKATVVPSDAANQKVTWSSSDIKIATVDAGGVVTGVKQGTATITVKTSDGGKQAKCKITVNPPSIKVNPQYVKLCVGEKTRLSVEFSPSDTEDKNVQWSRSVSLLTFFDPVADIDQYGNVVAKRAGKTIITAKTKDGRKSTCTVEVEKKVLITSMKIEPDSKMLSQGEAVKLKVRYKPDKASDPNWIWSSSNNEIATVDSNGLVRGIKGGTLTKPNTVTITAKSQDGSKKKATCVVSVISPFEELRFNNIPVYKTKDQITNYNQDDNRYNDKKPDYFVKNNIYKCKKKETEDGQSYYNGEIAESDAKLFEKMKKLSVAASGKLKDVYFKMAEKFHSETGGTYVDDDLSDAVNKHKNTLTYCQCVEKHLKEVIKEHRGDIGKLNYSSYSNRDAVPLVNKMSQAKRNREEGWSLPTYDVWSKGLGITVHGWIINNIYVDNFFMNANGAYSCNVRYEFYDVFGLDETDISGGDGQNAYGNHWIYGADFKAWYILQHLSDYRDSNGFHSFHGRPFFTKAVFSRRISGNL